MDAVPEPTRNRVNVHRKGLSEWYLNGALGVERGFVMHEAAACMGLKRVVMSIEGDSRAKVDDTDGDGRGESIRFVDAEGRKALSFTDLFVMDAAGKTIPAWLSVNAQEMTIAVDDEGAMYPLVLDPLVWGQQAKLTASDGAEYDVFGQAVSLSGDTALVGADASNIEGNIQQGSVYVFERNGTTWTEQQKLIVNDGGCACQTSSNRSSWSGNLAALAFALFAYRRHSRGRTASWFFLTIIGLYSSMANAEENAHSILPTKQAETTYRAIDHSSFSPASPAQAPSMWGRAMGPPSKSVTRWYGWQTLIPLVAADAVVVGAIKGPYQSDVKLDYAAAIAFPLVHLFAGPIVHVAHDRFDKAAGVLAMNLVPPALGFWICSETSMEVGLAVFTTGVVMVQLIDVAVISNETVQVPLKSAKSTPSWMPSAMSVVPMVDSKRYGLALVGQF